MIKNKYVAFALFVILFFALWIGLRYLQGTYKDGFDLLDGIVFPLTVSVVCGYFTILKRDWSKVEKSDDPEDKDSE